nr:hypothetical protein BaRGS_011298 [Batillaria attramentaria]
MGHPFRTARTADVTCIIIIIIIITTIIIIIVVVVAIVAIVNVISRCEFAGVLQTRIAPFEAGLLFNELDTDNDNSLTKTEVNNAKCVY